MIITRLLRTKYRILDIMAVAAVLGPLSSCSSPSGESNGEPSLPAEENMEWLQRKEVKIAACQVVQGGNPYEVMLAYLDSAAADGTDMIVFPEYIAGSFTLPVKESDPVYRILEAARKHKIYVIIGGWEEFEPGAVAAKKEGAFSNTALVIDRSGEVIGKYRKMHAAVGKGPHWWPPLPDQAEWIMKAGEDFPVFTLDFGRIGIMTCYDGYFPEPASILSLHGAEIVVWINGRGGAIEKHLVQSDMQRNYIAMVATNLGEGAGTLIAQNHGRIDAYVEETGNHYISSVINLEDLRVRRANSRVHHQRRPGLYGTVTEKHETWKVYEHLMVDGVE